MVDERLLELLHDCDLYLVRQRTLLLRAAVLGAPEHTVAMDAALDQLAASVTSAWRAALLANAGERARPERWPSPHSHGDPGE
jgi:hypothetical protein